MSRTITLATPTTGINVVTVLVQTPTANTFSTLTSSQISTALATDVCGIQGSTPDGQCLSSLPPACQAFSTSTLLGAVLNPVEVLACQTALGVFGTVNAVGCFTGNLVTSLTGLNLLSCIQAHVPMCSTCLPALPSVCTNLGSGISILDVTALTTCQTALGVFGSAAGAVCFTVGSVVSSLTGQNVLGCLQQNIPLCPTTSVPTPTALMAVSTVTGCAATAVATSCITALPSACQAPSSGLLGNVLGVLDTTVCQTALGTFGVVNAAVCFTSNLLSTLTSQDFTSCLTNHLPMCGNNCVSALPLACQPSSGQLGSACQIALGLYGTTDAVSCFLTNVLSSVVNADVVSCLNRTLSYCSGSTLSTVTQTSGSIAYISTVTSVIPGNILNPFAGPTTTTYVLVNQPSPTPVLSTSYITVGQTAFTSTVTSINPGLIGIGGYTTTYVLVDVPIVLSTVTRISGSLAAYTRTVSSAPFGLIPGTTYVEVVQPTPAPTLSTSYTTVGQTAFTSTVTSTIPGAFGFGGSTTTYVLAGVPITLSTVTRISGSLAAYTRTVSSAPFGLIPGTTYVEVVQPTPPPALSTSYQTAGSIGYTSTTTRLTTIPGAFLAPASTLTVTYVVVNVPTRAV
jgi:hypothetical protein